MPRPRKPKKSEDLDDLLHKIKINAGEIRVDMGEEDDANYRTADWINENEYRLMEVFERLTTDGQRSSFMKSVHFAGFSKGWDEALENLSFVFDDSGLVASPEIKAAMDEIAYQSIGAIVQSLKPKYRELLEKAKRGEFTNAK